MSAERRKIPLEVSSWMEKDLTLRKITANSRLLTNDTRQNIVLSRQFFSDLLNLSFARHRALAECDFNKKMFLRNQQRKSEVALPGLRPCVEQSTYGMSRPTTSQLQLNRKGNSAFISPSVQSFFSRPTTKSEPTFDRRQQPPIRPIRTADIIKSRTGVMPIGKSSPIPNQRPGHSRQMSRETLNRLAQPKGYRVKSTASDLVRSNTSEGIPTAEEIFAEIEHLSQLTSTLEQNPVPEKPKTVVDDQRFHHLFDVFSKVHPAKTSNSQTFKTIIAANTSLQDNEGQKKMKHPSVSTRKTEVPHHRQLLAEKLHHGIDTFLVDVGA